MANKLIPKINKSPKMSTPERQSQGIFDDYAVRKNIASREGTIEKVPVNNSDIANKKYVDDELDADPIRFKSVEIERTLNQALELLADSGFDTGTGWTLGANWSIAGSKATHGPAGASNLVNTLSVVSGATYYVTGSIDDNLGGWQITMGGQTILNWVGGEAGSFSALITTSNTNALTITATGPQSISDISVKRMYDVELGNLNVLNSFNVGKFQVQGTSQADSEDVSLESGDSSTFGGTTGDVNIGSGEYISGGADTGDVNIYSGDCGGGATSGDINIFTGDGTASGQIYLNAIASGAPSDIVMRANTFRFNGGPAGPNDDVIMRFGVGATNEGRFDWMEDEDHFTFYDDIIFSGDGVGLPYGSCYGNEIGWSQANAAQNTWYNVSDADMADGQLHRVTHDGNGKLTVLKAGRYLINYSSSIACSAPNHHIEGGIEVSGSGSADNSGQCSWYPQTANAEGIVTSTLILDLAANATLEFCIRTLTAGTPTLSVNHLNFTALQVGGT